MGSCGSVAEKPQYDPRSPLAFGSDKEVFMGTFKDKLVAVCVAKRNGKERLKEEVKILKRIGKHPQIVSMVYADTSHNGCVLALEAVEPLGFDLDRLVKQHVFAKQTVPVTMARSLIKNICSALDYMHGLQIIHRDIKSENVLITKDYEAKVIDMGIACPINTMEDRWIWEPKVYFAPEMCQGGCRQGKEVDVWGIGLILHQMYQHRWELCDASGDTVVMCPGRPSRVEPMDPALQEAMMGMLAFDRIERWSTKKCQEEIPPEGAQSDQSEIRGLCKPIGDAVETRKLLCKYKDSAPPLTAYAAFTDSKSSHLHGKRVDQIGMQDHNAVLLLVDVSANRETGRKRFLEKIPKKDTIIQENSWLYFGLPPAENTEDAILGLKKSLFPAMADTLGRSVNAKVGLMAFSLEFDCFSFPAHTPKNAIIGHSTDPGVVQLNIRSNFGLNLAGIIKQDSQTPVWFPGPLVEVEPGDLGLFVRCPCQDGSTEATVTDEQLAPLMDKATFQKIMAEGGVQRTQL